MLVIFLFAIDATIVSTSMPTIVAKLGGLELYSWVFSIYMLTSALATPIFGKLSDLFDRRNLMLAGIAIFVLGSALCGAAQTMEMMIWFRAIQGLGGGAIYALSFIVVGILYPAEKRAKMQGVISSIWGISSILGPLAGAVIVENWSWRWIFFVNLPLAAAASGLIMIGLKEQGTERRRPKLDLLGTATLLIALLLLFYALAQSAHEQRALNAELLGLIALGAVFFGVFLIVERRAQEPIMPLDLFHQSLFTTSCAVSTVASMGVFGAISYLPLYLQGVIGTSASHAGITLLLLSAGWTAGSLLAGHGMDRLGYRWVSAAGMVLLALGYCFFLGPTTPVPPSIVLINGILIGTGMGLANLTTLVAAQTTVPKHRIGVATSTIMLFRTFGGAFGISLMGTLLLVQMQQGLAQLASLGGSQLSPELRDKIANPQNLLEPATRALIPPELLPPLVETLADALWYAFFAAFVLMLLGIAISLFMPHYAPAKSARPDK
ncbi:MAG TPA: MDR family MFS transporter [Candidatus Binatia bacterium]|nr:MDR family MFS transporter [Candidatus Binatia bacterium]